MSREQIVVFKLKEHEFGINVKQVLEILNYTVIRPIPDVAEYVEGITNVRGKIYSIFNLRKRLNITGQTNLESSKFILLQVEGSHVGFLVDNVAEILTIDEICIEKVAVLSGVNKGNSVQYIVQQKERMIMVLDVHALIWDEENLLNQGVSDEESYCSNTK